MKENGYLLKDHFRDSNKSRHINAQPYQAHDRDKNASLKADFVAYQAFINEEYFLDKGAITVAAVSWRG